MYTILRLQCLVIVLCLCSCSFNNKKERQNIDPSLNNVVEIDLDNSNVSENIKYSSFLSMPRTIILDNNEEALIERIYELDIYNDNIYILDDKLKRFLVFDVNGKYKYRIGKTGMGPGEYLELSDFSIDREQGFVYLLDEGRKRVLEYNLNTLEFIKDISVGELTGQNYSIQYFNGKLYINQTAIEENRDNFLLGVYDVKTGKCENKILDSQEYNNGWKLPLRTGHSNFYSKNSTSPLFVDLFGDKIISFKDSNYFTSYLIKSDNFICPDDIKEVINTYYKTGLIDLFPLYKSDKIYKISNLVDMNKYLFFKYRQGMENYNLLYDKSTNKVTTSKLMLNDLISSTKPLRNLPFLFSNENGVVSLLRIEDLPYFIEEIIDKGDLNPKIDKYNELMNIDYDSNPIIFYYEYKTDK